MLMHPSAGFQFDEHGLATGGPFPYFPSNGALLTAVAIMMCGGWDGSRGGSRFPERRELDGPLRRVCADAVIMAVWGRKIGQSPKNKQIGIGSKTDKYPSET
ncbi:MAG: hypothetical protein ACLR6J_00760 [Parabacteroides merdae]